MLHRLRRSVGLVFQFHCLFEHMSALQNVCLAPVHVYRQSRREPSGTGRELLKQLGVESRADAWPRELSGGEAQRVAIARALAVNPPVLLMDEPMASLDPSRRAELGALLQRLTASGRTLLVTTHDERFAEDFATRVLTIDGSVRERVRVESLAISRFASGWNRPPTTTILTIRSQIYFVHSPMRFASKLIVIFWPLASIVIVPV